jgi:hypothetical protein
MRGIPEIGGLATRNFARRFSVCPLFEICACYGLALHLEFYIWYNTIHRHGFDGLARPRTSNTVSALKGLYWDDVGGGHRRC